MRGKSAQPPARNLALRRRAHLREECGSARRSRRSCRMPERRWVVRQHRSALACASMPCLLVCIYDTRLSAQHDGQALPPGMGAGARLRTSDPKSRELDPVFTQGVTFLEQRLHAYSKVRERELKLKPKGHQASRPHTASSAALNPRVARPASPSFQEWMQVV
jgi:hypothetical protein